MKDFIKRFITLVKWLFTGGNTTTSLRIKPDVYFEILSLMAEATEANHSTFGHSERMLKFVTFLGKKFGMSRQELEHLKMAATLHDVGKIGIDKKVFLKPSKLTLEEYDVVKRHSTIGANIINNFSFVKDVSDCVKYHHERWDGTGYPEMLKDQQIPLGARILSVVDSFDAMISERPYKKPKSLGEAFDELKKNSGTQFDKKVVDSFMQYDFQSM